MLEQRLFRLLLWLYPSSFRERYERDMVAVFREARDERGRSHHARARFCVVDRTGFYHDGTASVVGTIVRPATPSRAGGKDRKATDA